MKTNSRQKTRSNQRSRDAVPLSSHEVARRFLHLEGSKQTINLFQPEISGECFADIRQRIRVLNSGSGITITTEIAPITQELVQESTEEFASRVADHLRRVILRELTAVR